MKLYFYYSQRQSRDLAQQISQQLTEHGHDVLGDQMTLNSGVGFNQMMYQQLLASDAMVILVDEVVLESKWAFAMVAIAEACGIPILPLIRESGSVSNHKNEFVSVISNYQSIVLQEEDAKYMENIISSMDKIGTRRNLTNILPKGYMAVKPLLSLPSRSPQFICDVFMVMPFAHTFTPLYTDHIKPLVEKKDLAIKRGDDFFAQQAIMSDVWSAINSSKLVIVDCTGKNANVFYELGIAHTLGRPTIMITQSIDDIPFDIRHLRMIVYEYTPTRLYPFQAA